MSSDRNLVGDHPWLGGTTYGVVDSPAGPSMVAINSPAGPSMATKFAVDDPAGPVVGGDHRWGVAKTRSRSRSRSFSLKPGAGAGVSA